MNALFLTFCHESQELHRTVSYLKTDWDKCAPSGEFVHTYIILSIPITSSSAGNHFTMPNSSLVSHRAASCSNSVRLPSTTRQR